MPHHELVSDDWHLFTKSLSLEIPILALWLGGMT